MPDGSPHTNETEDALYKSMGRFSVQKIFKISLKALTYG